MKIITAKQGGFCFGVKNAVDLAMKNASNDVCTYGELIHNEIMTERLSQKGVKCINNIDEINCKNVIIRSHGVKKSDIDKLTERGINIIDATCPFVKKIHCIVSDFSSKGYHIVIIGKKNHPEVEGISGWCNNECDIIDENTPLEFLNSYDKLCFVAQTTFEIEKYNNIIKKIEKQCFKTVEIFDTICYTTYKRQIEAAKISAKCSVMLVLGSKTSSNTSRLYDICKQKCDSCFFIENMEQLNKINFKPTDTVGIAAGASTPSELIMEVKDYMSQQFEEVQSREFIDGVEESLVSYKEGKCVKGTVILANDAGIKLNIGGKKDGFIPKDEINVSGEYDPSQFQSGQELEAMIIAKQDNESGCVLLSKKRVDQIKEGDKVVETIRNGEVFEFKADKDIKGGLLGKIGTYTVFIPASHIKDRFVKDLSQYVNRPLRLTAIEIDDAKRKIIASQRIVIEREKKDREEIFWSHVQPNVIVSGKVKRTTNFGAFVSVDGFDCLAHIADLSWNHIRSVGEVLKIGETYDFLVLNVDKEKGRVSLSYKLLQQHPFESCIEKHPIGSILKGKVTSIVPFGAFVEIEKGIEGLVHVSEAAHKFVKSVSEVVKVGDEVDVMIINADPSTKKITLSIKATLPEEEAVNEAESEVAQDASQKQKPAKKNHGGMHDKKKADSTENSEWSDETTANTPFADLLKDLDIKK